MEGISLPLGMQYTDTRSKRLTFSRDLTLASGNVSYTGAGFKPSEAFLSAAVDGTNCYTQGKFDKDGTISALSGDYATLGKVRIGGVFYLNQSAGYVLITLVTYDSDGITLHYDKTGSPTGTAAIEIVLKR